MFWLLKTSTPSQSEIFFVIVASSVYLPFRSETPSQGEIFYVIVTCSVYLLFNTSTSSQIEIFFQSCSLACSLSLYVCIHVSRCPLKDQNTKLAPLRRNILLWKGVLVFKSKYTKQGPRSNNKKKYFVLGVVLVFKNKYTQEATITKNILLFEGVLVLKSKYTQECTITKNISLWAGVLHL